MSITIDYIGVGASLSPSTPGVTMTQVPIGAEAIGVTASQAFVGIVAIPSWDANVYYTSSGLDVTLFFSSPAPPGAIVFWQITSTVLIVGAGLNSVTFPVTTSSPLVINANWNTTIWLTFSGSVFTVNFSVPVPSGGGILSYVLGTGTVSVDYNALGYDDFTIPEGDLPVGVFVTPNWNTASFLSSTESVSFDTPAPSGALLNWELITGIGVPTTLVDRSICLSVFASNQSLVNASYFDDLTFVYADSTLTGYPMNSGSPGYIDCAQDGSNGFYLISYSGEVLHVTSPGNSFLPITIPESDALTGLVYTSGVAYIIDESGNLFSIVDDVVTTLPSVSGSIVKPARLLVTDDTYLYTMAASGSTPHVAAYSISASGWTVNSVPLNFISTISTGVSGTTLLAGGSSYLSISTSATDIRSMGFNSGTSQLLVPDSSTDMIYIYDQGLGNWSFSASVSGVGSPTFICMTPGGQALVSNPGNNEVQVLSETGGIWSSVSLSVSGTPTGIAVAPSGLEALVTLAGLNAIGVLTNSSGTWSYPSSISLSEPPEQIAISLDGNAAIIGTIDGSSYGVTFLSWNGVNWAVGNSVSLPSISTHPLLVAVDSQQSLNTNMYAVGSDGTNTYVYIFSETGTLITSYTLNMSDLNGLMVLNTQIFIFSSTEVITIDGLGIVNGSISPVVYTSSIAVPSFSTSGEERNAVAWTGAYLLVAGNGTVYEYINLNPFNLIRSTVPTIIYSTNQGSSWTTTESLASRSFISTIAEDSDENIYAITVDNNLFKLSYPGYTVADGYPQILLPPGNQEEGVPLGVSKLIEWSGDLWAASSLYGGLIQITGF